METTSFRAERFRLPQELVDHIIDELTEDTDSLRACALTSQSLRRPSQRNLFYCTKLYPTPNNHLGNSKDNSRSSDDESSVKLLPRPSLCERLYLLLETSPHIAALIKDLRLRDTEYVSESWLTKENSLPLILPRLSSLQRIYVAGSMSETLLNMSEVPSSVKEALFKAIRSPKITHLGFQCVQFPTLPDLLEAISGCVALKSLTLFAVDLCAEGSTNSSDEDDDPDSNQKKVSRAVPQLPSPTSTSHLSSLGLFMGPSLSSQLSIWLLSPESGYSLSNLEKFSLVAEMTQELSLAKQVVAASKGSLREMNITIVEGDEGYNDILDVSSPRVIYFGLDISSSDADSCQPVLNWWCNSLESCNSHNLETFNVFVLTELDDITDFEYTAPGWKRLDDILSRDGMNVRMNVRLKLLDEEDDDQKDDPVAPPELLEKLKDAFPAMRDKSRLEVSQMTESLFFFLGVYWQ